MFRKLQMQILFLRDIKPCLYTCFADFIFVQQSLKNFHIRLFSTCFAHSFLKRTNLNFWVLLRKQISSYDIQP